MNKPEKKKKRNGISMTKFEFIENTQRLRLGSCTLAIGLAVAFVGSAAWASTTTPALDAARVVASVMIAQQSPPPAPEKKPEVDEKEKRRLRELVRKNINSETLRELYQVGGSRTDRIIDETVADPPAGPDPITIAPVAPPTEKVEGPHIVFDTSVHNFGLVVTKTQLTCKFTFRNAGTQKLIIEKVNTGCGCTVANMPKQEFEPGEAGVIDITYDPKGTGPQNRSIQVLTNDAKQRVTTVALEANVLPLVEARPNTLQFGQVLAGETRTIELVIVGRDPDLTVESVTTNGPEITVKEVTDRIPTALIEPELPGRKIYDVTLGADADVGRVLKMITFQIKAGKQKGDPDKQIHQVNVNAFAAVKGELSVQPPFIRVRPLATNEPFDREAIITREGGKPFKILEAKVLNSTIEGVTVSVEPYEQDGADSAKGYKVIIRGNAGDTAKNFRGAVVVTTDMPKEKSIEIQFSGLVRPPVVPGAAN